MINHIEFPQKNEYPSYAEMYMHLINKDGDLIKQLKDNSEITKDLVNSLSTNELEFKYASGRQTLVFLKTNVGWKIVHEHGTPK